MSAQYGSIIPTRTVKQVHTYKKSQIITEKSSRMPSLGTRFYGERTFSFGGQLLWNAVPLHLKEANSVNNFKSLLKTFLFQEYYN